MNMDKPKRLYHASHDVTIEVLQPHNKSPRYSGEVDLVFATPHEPLAAMFLAPRGIPIEIGIYGPKYALFIESDEATFTKKDKGGAIYTLPSDTFNTDTVHGMKEIEWYSEVSVKPLSKTVYKTAIEALEKYSVSKYFVDAETMKKIREDPAHALDLVE